MPENVVATERRVYKYPTGFQAIPPHSTFLSTVVENLGGARLVWHYFLVWTDADGNPGTPVSPA